MEIPQLWHNVIREHSLLLKTPSPQNLTVYQIENRAPKRCVSFNTPITTNAPTAPAESPQSVETDISRATSVEKQRPCTSPAVVALALESIQGTR